MLMNEERIKEPLQRLGIIKRSSLSLSLSLYSQNPVLAAGLFLPTFTVGTFAFKVSIVRISEIFPRSGTLGYFTVPSLN